MTKQVRDLSSSVEHNARDHYEYLVLNQITIVFPTKLYFTESRAEMPGFPLYQQFWRELQVWSVGLTVGIKILPPWKGREFFYTCAFRFYRAVLVGDRLVLNSVQPQTLRGSGRRKDKFIYTARRICACGTRRYTSPRALAENSGISCLFDKERCS